MKNEIYDIVNLIEKEIAVYGDYADVSKKKTEIIEANDIATLDSIVKFEQALIMKITRLESKRQALISSFKEQYNIKGEVSSKLVEEQMDAVTKQRFQMMRRQFVEKFDEQKTVQMTNEKLIKSRLEYVQFALDKMSEKKVKDERYSNKLKKNEVYTSQGIFDKKV